MAALARRKPDTAPKAPRQRSTIRARLWSGTRLSPIETHPALWLVPQNDNDPITLECTGGPFHYDASLAQKAVDFVHNYLVFTTGEWAGRPFKLELWQERIIRAIWGWRRADGTRRYRRLRLWVPRKNGKTELLAAIALLLLVADGEAGGHVYAIAADEKQAGIVFDKAYAMVTMSPGLARHLDIQKSNILCPALMSVFRPLSGTPEGKHGLNAHASLGDEVHEWKNDRLYTFVRQSMAARRQPLDVIISTAGEKLSYGHDVWKMSQRIASGLTYDPETLVVIFAASPLDDWTDRKTWYKANPNLGVSVKLKFLEDECRQAKENPRQENDFKRYHLNIWTEQAVRWLAMDAWRAGSTSVAAEELWKRLPDLCAGQKVYAGLDLSSTRDITSLTYYLPQGLPELGNRPLTFARHWVPAENIERRARREGVPFDRWAKDGAVIATEGNVVDYDAIVAQIMKDSDLFQIAAIGVDRWNATGTIVKLQELGAPVQPFGQGFASMSSPSKELERIVSSRQLEHGHHPALEWMAGNVAVTTDAAGNVKPAKDKSSDRIDGIVALVMAIGMSMAAPEKPKKVISTGFLEAA